MPLAFLAPAFLAGLLALGIPLVLHLIQRERKDSVPFPSLMFLQRVPHKSVRRRRIRDWPLLVLRCLAIALVVSAFARPFLNRPGAIGPAAAPAREVVVLLDRSYSMGYGDRWTRARAAARQAVDALRPADRASLVLFDDEATAVVQASADRARLRAALHAATVGAGATRYAPALKLAQSVLEGSRLPRREVVLVSDFQRRGWDGDPTVRLPAGTRVSPVDVGSTPTNDLSVAAVELRRESVAGRERVTVRARIANRGAAAVRALPVTLELDGRPVQDVTSTAPGNGVASVAFRPVTLEDRPVRGTVRLPADALQADDAFHFVLSPAQGIGVLVVEGAGSRSDASLYLRRALAVTDAAPFRVDVAPARALATSNLSGYRVVVLNDAAFPAGEAGRRLRAFVEAGGGLVVALGDRSADAGWALAEGAAPLRDRTEGAGAIGAVEYGHPVFEVFRAAHSGDFGTARFFRYRQLTAPAGVRVLARLDDGSPLLVERPVGKGRALVWASTLDTYWNDLPLRPVYLPFVHRLIRYASGVHEPAAWATVGQTLDAASLDRTAAEAGAVVLTPSGRRIDLKAAAPVLRLDEAGFYEVRRAADPLRAGHPAAANVDPAEADPARVDPAELVSAVTAPGGAPVARRDEPLAPAELEKSQAPWWYLLVVGFLLLAVETTLSNRRAALRRPAVER
ncbi:MAG TPA: BatA domain-containing protein [Longimicrobiales bacterium]|nr:BatA domain-containing protein [Longimicrobiales bacterium]